jgi:hypothetical protein
MIAIVGTYFSPIFSATFLHSSDMLLISQKVISSFQRCFRLKAGCVLLGKKLPEKTRFLQAGGLISYFPCYITHMRAYLRIS